MLCGALHLCEISSLSGVLGPRRRRTPQLTAVKRMKRTAGLAGPPDVLQKLGRPGFPKGMVVLLVGGAEYERYKIEKQMSKLCYEGTLF